MRLVDKWLDYQDPLPKPPQVPIRLRPLRQRQGFLVESDLRRLRAMIVDALEKDGGARRCRIPAKNRDFPDT